MRFRVFVLAVLVASASSAAPLGTEVTYQGVLSDAGSPANGVFDLRYVLFDAAAGGSQIGPVVLAGDVSVTDGRIAVNLDFGPVFDGTALWLEIGVRDGGSTGSYTLLSPRQTLTAAPFAQHAQVAETASTATNAGHAATADSATTATSAASATDADNLNGQNGTFYLLWSNFLGIPGDLADGDDDTLADLSCASDEIARWDGLAWNCSTDNESSYTRTFVVGPVGTALANGTALRDAIAAIPAPSSQEEAVLVKIEAGLYDIGTTRIVLNGWTSLEGAGRELTKITGAVCDSSAGPGTGMVSAFGEASGVRRLWLENTCSVGTDVSIALKVDGNRVTVEHARLEATGSAEWNYALSGGFSSSGMRLKDAELRAENAAYHYAINSGVDDALLDDVFAEATGGTWAIAFSIDGQNVVVRSSTFKATDGSISTRALYGYQTENLVLDDTVAEASSSFGPSEGIYLNEGTVMLNDVRASGEIAIRLLSPSTVSMYDVIADGSSTGVRASVTMLDIRHSLIRGSSSSVYQTGGTVTLQGVILDGGPVSGTVTCTTVTRGTTFLASGCP